MSVQIQSVDLKQFLMTKRAQLFTAVVNVNLLHK